MISDLFGGVHPSILWGVLAIILAVTEMILPGVFLIWLAVAAALTAGLASLLPISEPFQLLAFAIFSALSPFCAQINSIPGRSRSTLSISRKFGSLSSTQSTRGWPL